MIETSNKLGACLVVAAVLSFSAACNVSASGQIPCADDSSCPATYPSCKAGFCAEGAPATTVSILGVPGKAATDPVRGTVTVAVVAKAASGVKSVSLAAGTTTYTSDPASNPPVFNFTVDTTRLADGTTSLTATVTPGDSTQAATTSAAFSLVVQNTAPTLTVGVNGSTEASDGTLVAIDVISSKTLASLTGTVAGSATALAQIAAPTGLTYHFGYAVTASDSAGAHSVTVTGVDLAGNSSSSTLAGAFNVRHPFSLGALSLSTGHTVNEQAGALPAATAGTLVTTSLAIPASAALGSAKPVFKLTSSGGTTRTLSAPTLVAGPTSNTWTTSYAVVASDNDGVAAVTASVTDLAGNTPTAASASLVIDKTAPLSTGIAVNGQNFDTVHNAVVISTTSSKRLQSATVSVSNGDAGTCTCDGGACNASTSLTPLVSCLITVTHAAPATPVATLTLKDTLGNTSAGGAAYQTGYKIVPAPVNGGMSGTTTIGQGTSTMISASFSNGTGIVTGTDGSTYAPATGVLFSVSPNVTSTYSLVVTNPAGTVATSAATAVVSVLPPANISSFVGPQFYVAGQAVGPLRGVFGPTGALATVTGADAISTYTCAPSGATTSPQNFTCPKPTNGLDVTYTLTVTYGPVTTTATATVRVVPDPSSSIAFSVNGTNPVNPGDTTTFTGNICTGCTYSIAPANLIASSSVSGNTLSATSSALSTTTTFTLTVTDQAGVSASAPATVTVNKPSILSFTGPVYSTAGSAGILLTAAFGGGTGASASVVATAGSTGSTCTPSSSTTSPQTFTCSAISADTTFMLTVTLGTGANSTTSGTVLVKVAPNPSTTIAFGVNGGSTINPGGTTTLTGTVCTGCTFVIDPATSVASSNVSSNTLSATTTALQTTTTFKLTVINQAGASASLTATVTVNMPSILSFGGPVYSTAGVGGIQLTAAFGGGIGASAAVVATAGTTGSTCAPSSSTTSPQTFTCGAISADTTYTITVTLGSGANSTATATTLVKVAPNPSSTIAFSVSGTNPINPGGTTTFTGTVCTGCTFSIDPPVGIATSSVTTNSLTATTSALQTTTAFTLTVTNPAGASATVSATVNVNKPTITAFAGPTYSTTGAGGIALSATFGGGTGASAAVVATAGTMTSTCSPASSTTSPQTFTCGAITADTTYTLTVMLGTGANSTTTATTLVKVAPNPSGTIAFSVNGTNPINPGGTTTLTGTVCTGCTFSIDPAAGIASASVATNTLTATTNALQATTVFTLTVTNQAGITATAPATVTVNKPTITAFNGPAYSTTGVAGISLSATFGGGTGASAAVVATAGTTTSTCSPASSTISPQTFTCGAITADTTFTMTVSLGSGANSTTTATTLVKVAADPAATIALSVNGTNPINPGGTTTFTGTVCAGCTFALGPSSAMASSSLTATTLSATTNALQATTTFTLSVTNQAGITATAPATVTVSKPLITGFDGPASWTGGKGGIPLSATFGGGTGAAAAVVATLGSTASSCTPGGSTTSPQAFSCTAITQDTTYTLTVTLGTGPNSTATATLVVKVAPTATTTSGTMPALFGAAIALLPNGKVLIAGGSGLADGSTAVSTAQIFDPSTGTFTQAGNGAGCSGARKSMSSNRYLGTATVLPNGKVLLAGGSVDGTAANAVSTADIYDINAPDCFTALGPNTHLNAARFRHTATPLDNGLVLLAGGTGTGGTALASGELFDPNAAANQFSSIAGAMTARTNHTATPMNNGLVLLAGGTATAVKGDLFDYTAPTAFSQTTGTMQAIRSQHTATLLGSGAVLLAGGSSDGTAANATNTAEVYSPTTGNFTMLGNTLVNARFQQTATLLPAGTVLIAGGTLTTGSATSSTEVFDPTASSFSSAASLSVARTKGVATFLFNGTALVTGGNTGTVAADLFTP